MPIEAGQAVTPAGPGWEVEGMPFCAARRSVRAAPGALRGRYTAAPAPRPARVRYLWPCLALHPQTGACHSAWAPRAAASLPPAARTRCRPAPVAPALLARGARHRGGGEEVRAAGPQGAPCPHPHWSGCAGRSSSRAARRAAPRVPAALLRRCPLPTRSPPDTDSAFSCLLIWSEPRRLLRKKKRQTEAGQQAEQPGPSPAWSAGPTR